MRRLILGTAGHIDHGKTALVHALTGIDTDRLPEEKRRGITIDLGFARLAVDETLEFGIVDVPGHEGFVRNMLAGATGIDVALLVVAADEGVMPQTREHLAILDLLGVRSAVIALTKVDLVDADWLDLVTDDVHRALDGGPFEACRIVPVSARSLAGLDTLRETLAESAAAVTDRNDNDLFRMPIDRVFTVHGTGTIVTGTVWSGAMERDRLVDIRPGHRRARVRAVETHGATSDRVRAGQRAALALTGIDRSDIARGDVLAEGAGWSAGSILTVCLRTLDSAPPLKPGQRARVHLGTAETLARIVPFDPGPIVPGSTCWAQLRLERPIVARAGDAFVVRSYSPVTTIAGGRVAEPDAPRRKRPSSDLRDWLGDVLAAVPARSVSGAARLAGWAGVRIDCLPVRTPLSPRTIAAVLASAEAGVDVVGDSAFARQIVDDACAIVIEAVDAHHRASPLLPGLSREVLRQALPGRDAALADHAIGRLEAESRLVAEGGLVRAAAFSPTLTDDQESAAATLRHVFMAAGLSPPAQAELSAELGHRTDIEDLLRHLTRLGELVSLGAGRYVWAAAVDAAARLARDRLSGRDALGPADFREIFGLSRKHLIPLLEYFDRSGLTTRTGETRRLNPV